MANAPRIFGEGSTFDTTANVTFRGVSNRLVLDPNSTLEPDEDGVYTLTRTWWCRSDLVEQFLPREGDVDFQHRDLGYWKSRVQYRGGGALIQTWFNGFINRNAEVVKSTPDVQQQEVQVSGSLEIIGGTGNTLDFNVTVVYLAPTVVNRFATRKRPAWNEKFRAVPEGRCEILEILGPDGVTLTNTKRITDSLAEFGVKPVNKRTAFPCPQVGSIFRCSETVQRLLVREIDLPLI